MKKVFVGILLTIFLTIISSSVVAQHYGDSVPLYVCKDTKRNETFYSTDSSCPSPSGTSHTGVEALLGYILDTDPGGAFELFNCKEEGVVDDYFLTTNSNCDGFTNLGRIGYMLPAASNEIPATLSYCTKDNGDTIVIDEARAILGLCDGNARTILGAVHRSKPIECDGGLKLYDGYKDTFDRDCVIITPQTIKVYNNLRKGFRYAEYYAKSIVINENIKFEHVSAGLSSTGALGGDKGAGGGANGYDGGAGGRGGARLSEPGENGVTGVKPYGAPGSGGGSGSRGGGSVALLAYEINNSAQIILSGGDGAKGSWGYDGYNGRGGGGGGAGGAAGDLFLVTPSFTELGNSQIIVIGGNGANGGGGGEETGGRSDEGGGGGGGGGGGQGGEVLTFPWTTVHPSLSTVDADVSGGNKGSGGNGQEGGKRGADGLSGDPGQITTDTFRYPENTFYLCNDGHDNDMDGYADYLDTDCHNTCGDGYLDLRVIPLPPAMNWDFDPSSTSAYDGCCGDDAILNEVGVVLNVSDDNLAICRGKFPQNVPASTTVGYLWEEDEDLNLRWQYKLIPPRQIVYMPYIKREAITLPDPVSPSTVRGWYFCGEHPNFKDPSLPEQFSVLNHGFLCLGVGQGSIVECCEDTICRAESEFGDDVNQREYGGAVYQGPQNGDFDSKLVIEQDLGVSFEMPIHWRVVSNPGAVNLIEIKRDIFKRLMLKNTQTIPLVIESDFFKFANGTAVVRFNTTLINQPYGNFSMQYEVNVTYYDDSYVYLDHKQVLIDNQAYPDGKEVEVPITNNDAVYAKVQISVLDSRLILVDPASELYFDFIGVGAPYYCAPDVTGTRWITDLDEDQQACDAAGFTWTGEQCCGDDGVLEYYNDTVASCWSGVPFYAGELLVNPQVPIDRRDILVDEFFYLCNVPKDPYLNLFKGLVFNEAYCTGHDVWPGYFCDIITGNWSDEPAVDETGDFIGHNLTAGEGAENRTFEKWDPTGSASRGCCPANYCWTGTTCVEDQTDEPWQSGIGGYRCVDNGTGLDWYEEINKTAQDKQTLGYCVDTSQCLGIPLGGRRYDMVCVNDGEVFEAFVCQNGNWSTRTKFLAAQLLNYTLDKAPDNFTLYCDTYTEALNKFEHTGGDGYLLGGGSTIQIEEVMRDFVSDVCVLEADDEVILGVVLKRGLDDWLEYGGIWNHSFLDTLTNTPESTCNNPGIGPDEYVECFNGDDTIWYNNYTKTVIYAKEGITLVKPTFIQGLLNYIIHPIQSIFGLIGKILNPRLPSGELLSFNVLTVGDLNKLYVAEKAERSVIAVHETQFGGDPIIALDFVDFHSDICSTIRVLVVDLYGTGEKVSCQPVINTTTQSIAYKIISAANQEDFFDPLWYGLTKELRVISKTPGSPVAQIMSPVDDSVYLSNDVITLLANKTNTTQSYYWDIDPVGDVLTGELAGYEVSGNAPLILGADMSYQIPKEVGLVRYGQHNLTLIAIGFDGTVAYDSILFNISSAYGCKNMLGDMDGDGDWDIDDWFLAKCMETDGKYSTECGTTYPILENDNGTLISAPEPYHVCFDINQNEELDLEDSDLFISLCGQSCDQDLDGVLDPDDTCPSVPNPDNIDTDGDDTEGCNTWTGFCGDACDDDDDDDGVLDTFDNCPFEGPLDCDMFEYFETSGAQAGCCVIRGGIPPPII